MALGNSQPDLAVDLIQRGGDIHAKTDWGWTPLLHAVKHSYGEVARILIDRGGYGR